VPMRQLDRRALVTRAIGAGAGCDYVRTAVGRARAGRLRRELQPRWVRAGGKGAGSGRRTWMHIFEEGDLAIAE